MQGVLKAISSSLYSLKIYLEGRKTSMKNMRGPTIVLCLRAWSGSYNTNLIKLYLYKFLKEDEEVKFMVKRNNNYLCIKTKYLKFLDVHNFLAPNFSYSAFLKAYDCQQQKGFFPYTGLDSLDKLESPQLPP